MRSFVPLLLLGAALSNVYARPLNQEDTVSNAKAAKSEAGYRPHPMDVTRKLKALHTQSKQIHSSSTDTDSNLLNASLITVAAVEEAQGPPLPEGVSPSAGCTNCNSSLSFAGAAAKKHEVGNNIPSIPFKTKTSWAGNIAISGDGVSDDPSLFFWLWGKDDKEAGDDLVIWLNGGPGCSSLAGMLEENGPFLYLDTRQKIHVNPYSWTKAANILYVEQPVKTGFTTGKTSNTNEDQVAQQFSSFLQGFFETFPELKGKKLYVTGESYAGTYIPNIMNKIFEDGNKFNLQSGIIIDGVISDEVTQTDLVAYDYAVANQKTLKLTDDDLKTIKAHSDKCGFTNYTSVNLQYPPKGKLPDYNRDGCSTWNTYYEAATSHNSKFNIYNIDTDDNSDHNPLGNANAPQAVAFSTPTFFDNKDLQNYIHAPHQKWVYCNDQVFPQHDQSLPPDQKPSYKNNILASVIENSKSEFIVMQGQLDGLIITNGTSIALQNLTWNGEQGFSQSPFTQTFIDVDGKRGGTFTSERGLSYVIVPKSGHMIPGDTPSVGLAALESLLGQRALAG